MGSTYAYGVLITKNVKTSYVHDAASKKTLNTMNLKALDMSTTQKKTTILRSPSWCECAKIITRQKSSDGAACMYRLKVFWFSVGIQSLVKTSD
jgi:hypothetical protein